MSVVNGPDRFSGGSTDLSVDVRVSTETPSVGWENIDLEQELHALCRGRGVPELRLRRKVGPVLAQLVGQGCEQGREAPGTAVDEWLRTAGAQLPDDLRAATMVALGLHPQARQRFLRERLSWLADREQRDIRTIRRRCDEGLRMLAALATSTTSTTSVDTAATAQGSGSTPASDGRSANPWYVRRMRVLVRITPNGPEILDERVVSATAVDVGSIVLPMSLPRPPDPPADRDLLLECLWGGLVVRRERPSESQFRFTVELPATLSPGTPHHVLLRWRLPPGQPMAPHFALTPLIRCDDFSLRVSFSPGFRPGRVWRLDGIPPRALDDEPTGLPEVRLDRIGAAAAHFPHPALGRAYGFRWLPTQPS